MSSLRKQLLRLMLAVLFLILGFAIQCAGNAQQPQSFLVVSTETYARVLDIVFPRDSRNFTDQTKEFALILRFSSAFEAESQINITKHTDGRLEVTAYTLPRGSKGIAEQLDAIHRETGEEDASEMARRINVRKRTINSTERVRVLLRRYFALRLSPHLDTYAFMLDPDSYQLWYEATSNEVYYSLASPRLLRGHETHPIVRWMNDVRRTLLK